ncbi:hypothetical protein C8J56DRAFT_910332 [Mycena floridula]|nr:hypothetical protein C8J56DRAFT_910332 [Mycena floridula]
MTFRLWQDKKAVSSINCLEPPKIAPRAHKFCSMPIEIPERSRAKRSSLRSSPITRRARSPEMIFEMSPIATENPRSHEYLYPIGLSSSQSFSTCHSTEQKPLMYSFPVPSPPHDPSPLTPSNTIQEPRLKPWPHRRLSLPSRDEEDHLTSPKKTAATHKITGFTPIVESHSEPCTPRPVRAGRLSPPPMPSSFSSSPWILPGSRDAWEDSDGTEGSSPSAFEFDKYIVRRIEKENRSLRSMRSSIHP